MKYIQLPASRANNSDSNPTFRRGGGFKPQNNRSNCKTCGLEILWLLTKNSRYIPVEITETSKRSAGKKEAYTPTMHTKHFH